MNAKQKARAFYMANRERLDIQNQRIANGEVKTLQVCKKESTATPDETFVKLREGGLRYKFPTSLSFKFESWSAKEKNNNRVPFFKDFIKTLNQETQDQIKLITMFEN